MSPDFANADKFSQLQSLDKFRRARLYFLRKKHYEYYKKLFCDGTLEQHCLDIALRAASHSSDIKRQYIALHSANTTDKLEHEAIKTLAELTGDEVALKLIVLRL